MVGRYSAGEGPKLDRVVGDLEKRGIYGSTIYGSTIYGATIYGST